jgi:hypothetical protein
LYRSRPSKCNGVLTICTAAGATNCATLAAPTYLCISSLIVLSSEGASRGGRLKDAKMVRQSRTVKRAKVGRGTGREGPVDPKSCVKRLSLYRQSARFEVEVATNLGVPAVVEVIESRDMVDDAVSIEFAVK